MYLYIYIYKVQVYKGDEDRGRTGQNGRATKAQLGDGS